jgi:iron-sulfur cluster assembly protein
VSVEIRGEWRLARHCLRLVDDRVVVLDAGQSRQLGGYSDRRCAVLTLTPTAADTVRALLASARASAEPHAGVRISAPRPSNAAESVEVTLAAEPEATDQTIDEAGAAVFVDETAAEFLDDKVLDASVEAKGVRFTILNS